MKTVTRLYNSFQPDHYELSLTPDRAAMHFTGSVVITGKKTGRPSQRITLHQHGLTITQATIRKIEKKETTSIEVIRINHHKSLQEIRLHTAQLLHAGSYELTLSFEAPITKGMTGLYPCYFTVDGQEQTLLATQFESHHAREVFPCIDEPEAKATFDLSLTTEPDLTVLGNTPVSECTDNEDGTITTRFEQSPRMSSYLLAFVIGDLHRMSTTTAHGTEVNIWGTSAQPKESFAFALDVAKRSIEYFEEYFGVPYPLAKADHVALPDFSSGAMENWGLVTYREVALLLYPEAASQSAKEMIATVIAHETSHQWFGNLVTMKWWDDLWLNESFANMMEYMAVDALFPEWNIWESFVTAEGLSATRRDATPGVQAVKTTVHHPDEISTLFDPSIVYAKGGRLLYMLKSYIGDEAFRRGLQNYFIKHAYKNTQGKDLWAALSKASGKDVADFMNPWLEKSGFPVLNVTQDGTQLTLTQEHFLENPDKIDQDRLWPVPLFATSKDVPDVLSKKEFQTTLSDPEWIRFNSANRGHYIVNYTNSDHRTHLIQQVKQNALTIIDRLSLLSDSSMLARAGYQEFNVTLELLEAYTHESSEAVWDIMSLIIADTKRFIDHDPAIEAPLKSLVATLIAGEYARLGWDERTNESPSDQKLRATILGLGVYAEVPEIIDVALQKFNEYQNDPASISAELRGIIFSAAVKQNQSGAIEYLLSLHAATQNSDLQRDIAAGLTTTKDSTTALSLLGHVKDPKVIKPQDADRWLIYLMRNRFTREIAWTWMEDNWAWIVETYKNDKSYDNFPRYAAIVCGTRQWQERYKSFFEPKMDETVLRRNIVIGMEEITSRVAWLERDLAGVQTYFKAR